MTCDLNQLFWVDANGLGYGDKFSHVEPPLAKFEFGHERLTLPEAFAQFHLRYACVLTSLHKQFDYSPV
jgi:hypothetical protein